MSELHHVAACIVAGRESEARDLLASTATRTHINQLWPRSLLKLDKHLLIAARTTLAHVTCLLGEYLHDCSRYRKQYRAVPPNPWLDFLVELDN